MAKGLAALGGMAMVAAVAALTIAFGTDRQAHADNKFSGAGDTVTQSAATTTIETPSAAPAVKATPWQP